MQIVVGFAQQKENRLNLGKHKILRIFTLVAYLHVLALTVFHIHTHNNNGRLQVAAKNCNGHDLVDPFANSDAICSVLVFSQSSYLLNISFSQNDKIEILNVKLCILDQDIFGLTFFPANGLRAPPTV